MGVKGIKDWLTGAEEIEEEENVDFESSTISAFETSNSTKSEGEFSNKSSQVVVFEPRSYAESQGIGDHLKSGRGCVVNLNKLSKDQARRIIDFLSGIVYAIEGEIKPIGSAVYLFTPNNFGVYGEISDNEG